MILPDDNGVKADIYLVQRPAPLWADLGGATQGTSGTPVLEASGAYVPTGTTSFELTGAPANAVGMFEMKLGDTAPGTPSIVTPFVTNGAGEAGFQSTWPIEIPPGFSVYMQATVNDPHTATGSTLSNVASWTTFGG